MKFAVALLAVAAALVAGPAAAGAATVTAGGGPASVTHKGTIHFAVNARAQQQGALGAGAGTVILRGGPEGMLRLKVVCMTTDGNFSFIETQDERTGLYYDVTVRDSADGPDHFAYSGPYGDPICGGGVAQEDSFVTSGNLVVGS